jgi:hypothetical protein
MRQPFKRREFLQLTLAGTALGFGGAGMCAWGAGPRATTLISPGCRRSKVKVARLYLAIPGSGWPTPKLDLEAELRTYKAAFESLKGALADVEFVIDQMVTSPAQIEAMKNELKGVDGILVIHLNIGIWSILAEILKAGRPTMFFAVPYSGHEWASFGTLEKQPEGALMEAPPAIGGGHPPVPGDPSSARSQDSRRHQPHAQSIYRRGQNQVRNGDQAGQSRAR